MAEHERNPDMGAPEPEPTLRSCMDQARERLHALAASLEAWPPPREHVLEALRELRATLGEAEAADEELRPRDEELGAARSELEAERHRYLDLFNSAPDGYLVTDLAGVVGQANVAAAALLQTSRDALAGKPLAAFLREEDRAAFSDLLPRLAAGERVADWGAIVHPREREPFPALLTAGRRDGSGEMGELLWILRDVSARKATEEALRESEERLRHSQRLEAVGRLAGGIAHSFNNLLAAISFHNELTLECKEDPIRLREHVAEVRSAGERAATLARQLLAFSRKQVLQPAVLSVNRVLADLDAMLRRLIGEHIEAELALDPGAGAVFADLGQIEQVIVNLVVNARDAMPEGGRLRLSTRPVELDGRGELPAGPYVEIAVEDSGSGIDPEILPHIFEPFYTTKARDKGTGLGLATVHGIARQSGGDVRVESEPGRGAAFRVLLPRVEEGPAPAPAPASSHASARGTEVVLLVEDEDNIREPACEVLESRGYTVLAARDGAEALALAQRYRGHIDLLLTDVIMPGMSGGQAAEQLERARPGLRVLYISGYPEDVIAQHGVLEPNRRFLQKPFAPSLLLRTVREVLDEVR